MLHNYMSRKVHETLNGVNPSSSFRDMCFTKTVPNLLQLWQVFGPWASPYVANGQMTMTSTTIGLENSTELCMEKIRHAVTEIWFPLVWQPPAQTETTIPLQPGGLRGEKKMSRSWPRSNLRHSVQLIYLIWFCGRQFIPETWQSHIWPWKFKVKIMACKVKI